MDPEEQLARVTSCAEERYKLIRTRAVLIPGVTIEFDENRPPDWYDKDKYKECLKLAKKYFVSLFSAHLIGLFLVIQFPAGLAPLLATGNSSTVARLFRRYLSTLVHVKNWYEHDPFEKESPAWRSVRQVRRMHKSAAELMTKHHSDKLKNKKGIWMSQYDFAMTQWSFIGQVLLNPKHCGLHPTTDKDMEHFNYLWRVIGYCMGIEDQFNLCSSSAEESRILCQLIFDRDYRPNLEMNPHPAPIGWEMSKGLGPAFRMISPTFSWNATIKYWYPKLGLATDVQLDSTFAKFSYCYINSHFKFFMRFSSFHHLYSQVYRFMITNAMKNREKRENRLKKMYPNWRFEEAGCPIHIDLDYADVFGETIECADKEVIKSNSDYSFGLNNNVASL